MCVYIEINTERKFFSKRLDPIYPRELDLFLLVYTRSVTVSITKRGYFPAPFLNEGGGKIRFENNNRSTIIGPSVKRHPL